MPGATQRGKASGAYRPEPHVAPGRLPKIRPAVVTKRLSLTGQGDIRVALASFAHPALAAFVHPCTSKAPYRDGTTHVVFQPLDFITLTGDASSRSPDRSHADAAASKPPAE